ncbi:MAG TPA: hypothetical protein VJW76_00935 [Verrucomicrobiae bacterium]|nr:hypothetical protein [Verrucomicrobiae bacterium]
MDRRLRKYYYAITLNLFVWLSTLPFLVFPGLVAGDLPPVYLRVAAVIGVVAAAILQHWAYYDIYNAKTRLTTSCPGERN